MILYLLLLFYTVIGINVKKDENIITKNLIMYSNETIQTDCSIFCYIVRDLCGGEECCVNPYSTLSLTLESNTQTLFSYDAYGIYCQTKDPSLKYGPIQNDWHSTYYVSYCVTDDNNNIICYGERGGYAFGCDWIELSEDLSRIKLECFYDGADGGVIYYMHVEDFPFPPTTSEITLPQTTAKTTTTTQKTTTKQTTQKTTTKQTTQKTTKQTTKKTTTKISSTKNTFTSPITTYTTTFQPTNSSSGNTLQISAILIFMVLTHFF
jgi:hypothetical protein